MSVLLVLIPLSIVFAAAFLAAFVWAVRSGQYEDTCTPSMRLLTEECNARKAGASEDRCGITSGDINGVKPASTPAHTLAISEKPAESARGSMKPL